MWEGNGERLAKRYEGVSDVDVGGKWRKVGGRTGKEGVGENDTGGKAKAA